MRRHTVRQGESILSLSKRYGIPADKILNHSENEQISQRNRNTGILFPGDQVTIPDREIKEVDAGTGQRHHFRCTNRTAWLKIQFFHQDDPRSEEPYRLIVGTQESSGNLDQDGWMRVRVPVDARDALVILGERDREERINLRIGHLNPIDEISGVKQRLNNLGFYCGSEDDELNEVVQAALLSFQAKQGLEETGELDDATKNRLREVYGS